jgi:hypothetical protein
VLSQRVPPPAVLPYVSKPAGGLRPGLAVARVSQSCPKVQAERQRIDDDQPACRCHENCGMLARSGGGRGIASTSAKQFAGLMGTC